MVFADRSVVFPFGLSRSFTVFPKTARPSATHRDFMETRLDSDKVSYSILFKIS